jgi:N-acetylglucosaminylphosphatidylinositol deacetylase
MRKYSLFLELPIAILKTFSWLEFSPRKAWIAMSRHRSQFVWYRRLWVIFSRYQYINTYQRAYIKVSEEES